MRKALTIGIASGIIISIILLGGMYLKQSLPAGNLAVELSFVFVLFALIATTLWVSMNRYSRSAAIQWGSLNFTGLIASLVAALLISIAGFFYTTYIHPGYLSELMDLSQQSWKENEFSASSIAAQVHWSWFDTPLDFALYNFQSIVVVLFVLTILIATLYYVLNRNRISGHDNANNHELIF